MSNLTKLFSSLAAFGTVLIVVFMLFTLTRQVVKDIPSIPPTELAIARKLQKESKSWKNLQFELVDPELAPLPLRDMVLSGYRLVMSTHELLPNNVGDHLNCTNCHFSGGISTGGVSGGISLAGVAAEYPQYNARSKSVEDLPDRINSCFKNSMNGKPLALESQEMLALVTYLHWISARYPIYGKAPWLGLKAIQSKHVPNPEEGKKLYFTYCADCHGNDGDGSKPSNALIGAQIPPIFGPHAFNTSSGMAQIGTFASFIYHNMPYEDPHLLDTEALDIAAFVLDQPHPQRRQ